MIKYTPILISALLLGATAANAANNIRPGERWNDTSGSHINAHGGCVQYLDGTYYWFGEDRTGSNSNGISCYTSTDLYNWKRQGLVFKTSQALDPETGKCILERPKVLHNDKTGKWVMYIHWENGLGYGEARVCVAVSDKINGDYSYVDTFRPNEHDSRDQTIFKAEDGRAYHVCATDMNTNINVALLSEDYLSTEKNPVQEVKVLNGRRLEAPAVVHVGDTYFSVFSECSGWDPNPGHSATAFDPLGYWEEGRNFCIDNGSSTSYSSQPTYIFPVAGKEGAYVYMGDRWVKSDVGGKSEYVWLPLSVRSGAPTVKWRESWDMSAFDNCDRFARIGTLTDGAVVRVLDKYSDRWVSTKGNGLFIDDDDDATNLEFRLEATENPYQWRFVNEKTGKYLESVFGALMFSDSNDKDTQVWRLELEEDGCYIMQNVSDRKALSVSGGSQLAKTSVFMSNVGASGSQSFGLYFDVRKHDYEKADMYSAGYRAQNLELMQAQKDYEALGVNAIAADAAIDVRVEGSSLVVKTIADADANISVVEAASGRVVASDDVRLTAGLNTVDICEGLGKGIYLVEVSTTTGHAVRKIAL